jgi:hypothetical protein
LKHSSLIAAESAVLKPVVASKRAAPISRVLVQEIDDDDNEAEEQGGGRPSDASGLVQVSKKRSKSCESPQIPGGGSDSSGSSSKKGKGSPYEFNDPFFAKSKTIDFLMLLSVLKSFAVIHSKRYA